MRRSKTTRKVEGGTTPAVKDSTTQSGADTARPPVDEFARTSIQTVPVNARVAYIEAPKEGPFSVPGELVNPKLIVLGYPRKNVSDKQLSRMADRWRP